MRYQICLSALACVLVVGLWPALASAQPAKVPVTVEQPVAVQPAATPDICFLGYGLTPKERIKICSDVIDAGSLKGLGLGLAYFNRGMARANDGDPKGSVSDYKMALRFYTDVIRTQPPRARSCSSAA